MPLRVVRRTVAPIVRFVHVESAGSIVLLIATVVSLVLANSPWHEGWASLWHRELPFEVAGQQLDWRALVDEGLMAVFFFVVGLEIKREMVTGELRDRRAVTLPVAAALGGMIVPALVYTAFNAGTSGAGGWAIPMATDIAFATGIVALVGTGVPLAATTTLLGLAVVDDIGAIIVIAVFFSEGVDLGPLALAALVLIAAVVLLRRTTAGVLVALAGLGLWLLVFQSGVHPTIAGVALGLAMPAAACERYETRLHPLASFVVVPLFALANAGIALHIAAITSPSTVLLGVLVGLVVGKFVGIAGAGALVVRAGAARLPPGATRGQLAGVAAAGGIGFTVSLFIAGLAFDDGSREQGDAVLGTLLGSVIAALAATAVLVASSRRARSSPG